MTAQQHQVDIVGLLSTTKVCPTELRSHFLPNYHCIDFGGLNGGFAELLSPDYSRRSRKKRDPSGDFVRFVG